MENKKFDKKLLLGLLIILVVGFGVMGYLKKETLFSPDILISEAFELDEADQVVRDIYDLVRAQDDVWATIAPERSVKVVFEQALTSDDDITIYARGASGTPAQVKVYVEGSDRPVAVFPPVAREQSYKIFLTELKQPTDTFILRVVGSLELDYVVDPSPVTVTDTFTDETKIASKLNITVNTSDGQVALSVASTWTCGDALIDSRDGKSYGTVLIGGQCWMQQNLNVGTLVLGSATQGTSCATIEKYCYNDIESNCTTYGGLYQWDQAMCGGTTAGATGICPAGWHIPTHDEFTTLERATCTSGSCETDFPYDLITTGYRGTNEGTTLKNVSGDFRSLFSGNRTTGGFFQQSGVVSYFWLSVESANANAWYRSLDSSHAGVYRDKGSQPNGFSLRCLKD